MFLRFLCFVLLVCAFSQLLNKTATASASACASTSCPTTTTTTTIPAPKAALGNFAGSIVDNTKKAVHKSSNVVLGGVKNVGNIIKGGWNFADNVVDGSLNFAKKIGSLGYKIVTVVPKGLNDVLLDIVEKGQKKLKEKLEKEENKDEDKDKDEDKNEDSTTKAPDTTDGELFIYLNNLKIPVTLEQIVEVANVLKGTKDPFPLVADASPLPYFVFINNDEAQVLNADQLIEIGDELKQAKKKADEDAKVIP
ncbi:uncharacterized protein LOC123260563 [Cotesia glomerata]|uniref:uncharacterized protein LOC123260563 n=1 Tax=Cotesia glomerata TaxID=32391 RepID=UPI001D02FF46|nr:uncharacterized protein LOC123260563 [Cotesia glomerata]